MEYTRNDMTAYEAQCLRDNFPGSLDDRQMRDDMLDAGFISRKPNLVWYITERGKAAMKKALPDK